MISEITAIINSDKQKQDIINAIPDNLLYTFIDERLDRSKAYKFKYSFGTRMTPFIVAYNKDKPIRGFYGEGKEDVIESLINYLNSGK